MLKILSIKSGVCYEKISNFPMDDISSIRPSVHSEKVNPLALSVSLKRQERGVDLHASEVYRITS